MELVRALKHLFTARWATRRRFPPPVLQAIETAVSAVEVRHAGEIRVAIEAALDLPELWHRVSARERALQVFGHLGVWDTECNNGVLIYVLLADHSVQIVADRGIASRVTQAEWDAACRGMEDRLRAHRHCDALVEGVGDVGRLLGRHFPAQQGDRNEQPNQPVLL